MNKGIEPIGEGGSEVGNEVGGETGGVPVKVTGTAARATGSAASWRPGMAAVTAALPVKGRRQRYPRHC